MKKIISVLFIFSLLFFTQCKKESNPPSNTTVEQDKASIKTSLDELGNCIGSMKDGEGLKAIADFLNLQEGEILNEDWVTKIIENLDSVLNIDENATRFNLTNHAGTYSWNFNTEQYDKSGTPNDKIIVHFPAKISSQTNNAIFTFSKYQDEKLIIDGEDTYVPSSFLANLAVDGVELFKISGDATYVSPIPITINTSVFIKPFTYSISGNRVTSKTFTSSINIGNSNGCSTKIVLDAELLSDDYPTIRIPEDVKKGSATLTNDNLKIVTNIDFQLLNSFNDGGTVSELNSAIKTTVFINNVKIGDLILFEKSNGDGSVRIVYKDGSEEDAEVFYNPFLDKIEEILFPLFGQINLND